MLMRRVNGASVQEYTGNCMEATMLKSLACEYTWKWKYGKKIPLQDKKFIQIILGTFP